MFTEVSSSRIVKGLSGLLAAAALTVAVCAQAAIITTQGTWYGTDGTDGTLQGRDANGNPVALNDASAVFFYDTVLDLTWLGNWNANNGVMTWPNAMAWAAALDINGFTGWRLPNSSTNIGLNLGTTDSEMAHLWYVTLGNVAFAGPNGVGINTAYFQNTQLNFYWSGTEAPPRRGQARAFNFSTFTGNQSIALQSQPFFAAAVRPGDVLAVPEPGTLGLLIAALGAGAVVRRRWAHRGLGA